MIRQRGFALIVYALVALAILGTLAGIARSIYKAGVDHEKSEQAVRNEKAREEADVLRRERQAAGQRAGAALAAANDAAADYEARWRKNRGNNREQPLVTFTCPPAPAPGGAPVVADSSTDRSPGVGLRLTYQFLREYDGAWTGAEGKPVFDDTGRPPETPETAVTLDALLTIHAENASRCSDASRRFNGLIDLVLKLQGRPAAVPMRP